MKLFRRSFLITILLIILIYVTYITNIPNSIILFKGETLDLDTVFGINLDETNSFNSIETGAKINNNSTLEKKQVSLKLFNLINVKNVEVNTIPKTTVIPLGNSVRPKTIYKWRIGCR